MRDASLGFESGNSRTRLVCLAQSFDLLVIQGTSSHHDVSAAQEVYKRRWSNAILVRKSLRCFACLVPLRDFGATFLTKPLAS